MFGLGIWEIAVIAIIALVVVGPEKLPELARNLGKLLNDIKRTSNDFTRDLDLMDDKKKFEKNKTNEQQDESLDLESLAEETSLDESRNFEEEESIEKPGNAKD